MPFVLLILGVVFLAAAVRGKHDLLFDTLKDDFTGPNNFLYWGLALFAIGAVGYNKTLRPISSAFMMLVIASLLLSHRGFFNQFMAQVKSGSSGGDLSTNPLTAIPAGLGINITNPFG